MNSVTNALSLTMVILAMCLPISQASGSSLSRADRVACQQAMEDVYWKHRTWPAENPQPKPREALLSEAAIVEKVESVLLKSAAMEKFWQRRITPSQLRAEVERMARETRAPGILRDLFAALDQDSRLISECLARPLLADRLARRWYAFDERFHAPVRARAEEALSRTGPRLAGLPKAAAQRMAREWGAGAGLSPLGQRPDAESRRDVQEAVSWLTRAFDLPSTAGMADLPVGRLSRLQEAEQYFYAVEVLEQSPERIKAELAVWPKAPFEEWLASVRNQLDMEIALPGEDSDHLPQLDLGACADDTWTATTAPVPARHNHTAVWTGSELIIWGGFGDITQGDLATYGARYNPATDTWRAISTAGAPGRREHHTAVWTGSKMIIWGGAEYETGLTASGAIYDPAADTWMPTSQPGGLRPRQRHTAVWTGSEMIVWGGQAGGPLNTGSRYDPITDTWSATSISDAPGPREYHTAVWTGNRMVVWGGWDGAALNTGSRYDPAADSWEPTDTNQAPEARFAHGAVWSGAEMIIWGGRSEFFSLARFSTGSRYDPVEDTWVATSLDGAPDARSSHLAVWTGDRMVVWSGDTGLLEVNSGGVYSPASDSWMATSTVNVPGGRAGAPVVWTGAEMIVWGGWRGGPLDTGGRYDPLSDSWAPVNQPITPGARTYHTTIWTGSELIVWGGCHEFVNCPTATGGRYDPATNSWTPTSLVNAPARREFQNAVWTGDRMVVWGGCADVFCFARYNSGGRYDPATDSWEFTSTESAPTARYWHRGVWSGAEMIVWGGCDALNCLSGPPLPVEGGRYNPATDTWTPTNTAGSPDGRWFHVAVWSGSEMIVWGGNNRVSWALDTGSRYNPAADSWTPVSQAGAPRQRNRPSAVWTGAEMIVWGGHDLDDFLNTGGRYNPAADSWTPTATDGAPIPRFFPYLVWTEAEVIVWSGCSMINCLEAPRTGGRYDPVMDRWRETSMNNAPAGRADYQNVPWARDRMFVYGSSLGETGIAVATGGAYCASVPSGSITTR